MAIEVSPGARRPAGPTASPWTTLLGYVLDDEHRTIRAQRLMLTAAGCATLLVLSLVALTLLAYDVAGWLPLAGGAGTLTMLGIAAHRTAAWRRRQLDPPAPALLDEALSRDHQS